MDDPGTLWDALAELKLPKANTTALALGLAAKPIRWHLPELPRQVSLIDPTLRLAIRELVSGRAPWPLLILGGAGTGKTSAALCLLDHAGGIFAGASEWAGWLADALNGRDVWLPWDGIPRSISPAALWRMAGDTCLFVLDDLGAREVKDHHYESVKRLSDVRYGRPYVATSNHTLAQLAKVYDDRVSSRLSAGTVIYLDGEDRRPNRS